MPYKQIIASKEFPNTPAGNSFRRSWVAERFPGKHVEVEMTGTCTTIRVIVFA